MLSHIGKLSGLAALLLILALGALGTFLLGGWPFLRRLSWLAAAAVAVIAALNEFRR